MYIKNTHSNKVTTNRYIDSKKSRLKGAMGKEKHHWKSRKH